MATPVLDIGEMERGLGRLLGEYNKQLEKNVVRHDAFYQVEFKADKKSKCKEAECGTW
jgi:hypothetical protein